MTQNHPFTITAPSSNDQSRPSTATGAIVYTYKCLSLP